MHLSIIVITFNRADSLARAIRSVKALTRPNDWNFELIVVDNNSRDDTRHVVDESARESPFPIRYVFEPRQGTNFARNTGIGKSRGGILAFVDDDNTLARDWITSLQGAFAAGSDASTISGRVIPVFPGKEPGVMPAWVPERFRGLFGLQDFGSVPAVIPAPQWPHEMNIAVLRSVFEKTGGFGTAIQRVGKKLISNDGFDFVSRVRANGGVCAYHPAMLAYHHISESRATPEFMIRRNYWQGVSDARCDPTLAAIPRAHLLRPAPQDARILLRAATGGHLSPRRVRWHYLKLTVEQRCFMAYRCGLLMERLRIALLPRGKGSQIAKPVWRAEKRGVNLADPSKGATVTNRDER